MLHEAIAYLETDIGITGNNMSTTPLSYIGHFTGSYVSAPSRRA